MSARTHRIYLVSANEVVSVQSEDAAMQYDLRGYTRVTRRQYNMGRKVLRVARALRKARGS